MCCAYVEVADPATPPAARPLRVAVVGAGPAGIYAAEALSQQDAVLVAVDLIDRLPTPFGLVRYGIAPDHEKMRALRDTLHQRWTIRGCGSSATSTSVSTCPWPIRRHVDAVVYTYGASGDRRMGLDGEDLPGSIAATDLVAWYCGHPDADRELVEAAVAAARSVVVVGVGNVALDVARVLSRTPSELEGTDMPQHVLDALAAAPVREVTVVGRRGPAQAAFTTQELRELNTLAGATVLVDPADMTHDAAEEHGDRAIARNLAELRGGSARAAAGDDPVAAAVPPPPGANPRRRPGDRRRSRAHRGRRRRCGDRNR